MWSDWKHHHFNNNSIKEDPDQKQQIQQGPSSPNHTSSKHSTIRRLRMQILCLLPTPSDLWWGTVKRLTASLQPSVYSFHSFAPVNNCPPVPKANTRSSIVCDVFTVVQNAETHHILLVIYSSAFCIQHSPVCCALYSGLIFSMEYSRMNDYFILTWISVRRSKLLPGQTEFRFFFFFYVV